MALAGLVLVYFSVRLFRIKTNKAARQLMLVSVSLQVFFKENSTFSQVHTQYPVFSNHDQIQDTWHIHKLFHPPINTLELHLQIS